MVISRIRYSRSVVPEAAIDSQGLITHWGLGTRTYQWEIGLSLARVMAYRLYVAELLHEPMQTYYHVYPSENPVKCQLKKLHSRKYMWKCRL